MTEFVQPETTQRNNSLNFFSYSLRNFSKVGSLLPTSRRTASKLARLIPSDARIVVEFGAGNGAVTRPVLDRIAAGARFVCSEIGEELCIGLRAWKWSRPMPAPSPSSFVSGFPPEWTP